MKFIYLVFLMTTLVASAFAQSPPNVLWIISDDLNDYVWEIEGEKVNTPNLARLEQQGTRFEACYTNSPLCNPSRTSFVLGKTPAWTEVNNNRNETDFRSGFNGRTIVTLPEHFRTHGYYTIGVNKIFHSFWKPNFDNDFDFAQPDPLLRQKSWNEFWLLQDGNLQPSYTDRMGSTGYLWGPLPENQEGRLADHKAVDEVIHAMERFVSSPAEFDHKPLFVAVGIVKPHVPHFVPQRFFDQAYSNEPLEANDINYYTEENPDGWRLPDYGPPNAYAVLNQLPASSQLMAVTNGYHQAELDQYALDKADQSNLTPAELRSVRMANANMAYYAAVRYMDYEIGRLLDALDSLGLSDNTVIVFHSDHGFSQGERTHWAKSSMWERDLRVPLVIRAPNWNGPPVHNQPVSLLDLFPTFCDLAGLPYPEVDGDAGYLDGQSLLLQANRQTPPAPVVSQLQMIQEPALECGLTRSLIHGPWHYLQLPYSPTGNCHPSQVSNQEILYNLETDPNEWFNLASVPGNSLVMGYLSELVNAAETTGFSTPAYSVSIAGLGELSFDTIPTFSPGQSVNLQAVLRTSFGDTLLSPPAGTVLAWSLEELPGYALTQNSITLNLAQLALAGFLDDSRIRVNLALIQPSPFQILALDSRTIDVNGAVDLEARIPVVAPDALPLECRVEPMIYYNVLGQVVAEPQPGQVVVDACGNKRMILR